MAFKEKEIKVSCVLLFMATVISQMSFVTATNYDCKGKPFYCLNSTHFMICLDLGYGISTTMEDFVIPCPPPTICKESNTFECEYHPTTTSKAIQSEISVTEFNVQLSQDDRDYTTFLPFWYNREDSVKSEKYDVLNEQPNLLATEYTQTPDATYRFILDQSTTYKEVSNDMNKEKTTRIQDENISTTPTFSYVSENIIKTTSNAVGDEIVEEDPVSDGYELKFDTVSTTTLLESTTQMTITNDDIQASSYSLDEYITSQKQYTYQQDFTTYQQEVTLTTDFESNIGITTSQERGEFYDKNQEDIRNVVTTETDKNFFTNSDYTITSITNFQVTDKMLNEKDEINYSTTEMYDSLNNITYDLKIPSKKEESEIIKDVGINSTNDAKTLQVFTNSHSTTLPSEDIEINYTKTEATEINYATIDETNYTITTEIYEFINIVSVSDTEKNTRNEDYTINFPKSTNTIHESPRIDVKYVTHPYASQVSSYNISQMKNMAEETTNFPSSFSLNANVNIKNKNTQDITTNVNAIDLDSRMTEIPFPTNENFSEILQTTENVNITSKNTQHITTNINAIDLDSRMTEIPFPTNENFSEILQTTENVNIISKNTQDITTNINAIDLDSRMIEIPFPSNENFSGILQTTENVNIISENIQDITTNVNAIDLDSRMTEIPFPSDENFSGILQTTENLNIISENIQDITTNVNAIDLDSRMTEIPFPSDENFSGILQTTENLNIISENIQDITTNINAIDLDPRMTEIPFPTNENFSEILQTTENVNIISKNTQDITTNINAIDLDSKMNEITFLTNENFSEILQTTPYRMQDAISPTDYTETVLRVEQQSYSNTKSTTELHEYMSSTMKGKLREINEDLTVPIEYQITTDRPPLSPIILENIQANIKENTIVPQYSIQDNVTEIKINDTDILVKNYEQNIKQNNVKNKDKINANIYTTFTPSYDPSIFSLSYDHVMKNTAPDLENLRVTSAAFEKDFKNVELLVKTTSEPKNSNAYTIEDHTLATVFTNSPLLDTFLSDLYNIESNNQYEVTKETDVAHHNESPIITSTIPVLNDLTKLKEITIHNKNNLEKSVTDPASEINSTLALLHDSSSTSYPGTANSEILTTTPHLNNNGVNNSAVSTIEHYVTSRLQVKATTESLRNIETITEVFDERAPIGKNEIKLTESVTNIPKKSKPINATIYEDSLLKKIYEAETEKKLGNIPGTTNSAINMLSTTLPSIPTVAMIKGTKTVILYLEDSKSDVAKAPNTVKETFHSNKNTTVVVSHTEKSVNEIAHKKESVSIRTSDPCNRTISDVMMTSNQRTSNPITTKQSNFSCINRYSGKYSDQNNCQTFYMCIGSMNPIVGQCPQNSVFSDILNQCTRNLSHCIRNNQFQCVSPGRFSDLWARDTYYICLRQNGKFLRFKLRCQKGYLLNRTSITCIESPVKNFSISSESYSTSSISTDSKSEQSDSKNEDNEFKCEKEGVFPDPSHCRKYYVCKKVSKSKIQIKKKKCDSDEVFNKKKKKCVDEDSYEC